MVSAGMSAGVCRLLLCILSIQDMWQHFLIMSIALFYQCLCHIKFGKNLFFCCKTKKYRKLVLIANSSLKAVEIELIQSQHDILLSVARRLHQEKVLKKTHNRRINADNFENIDKGIPGESSVSIYLLPKKKFAESLRQIWIKERERILVISFSDNHYRPYAFLSFLPVSCSSPYSLLRSGQYGKEADCLGAILQGKALVA